MDQNHPSLEFPCFAIQDQEILPGFMSVIQSDTELDHLDPDTNFSILPNLSYQCCKWDNVSQWKLLAT